MHRHFLLLLLLVPGFFVREATAQDVDSTAFEIENPLLNRPEKLRVMGIKVIGTENYNASFIAASTGIEEGDVITYPGPEIPEAIRRLHRTGLFSDVQIFISQKIGDTVFLEIIVREQPRLDKFEVKGVKRAQRRELKEQIPLLTGFAVTESSKAQAVNTIKRFYAEKGYRETAVVVKVSRTDTVRNRVTLLFQINKGIQYRLKNIDFTGNKKWTDNKLKKSLKPLKQDTWWRLGKQTYKRKDYEEGIKKVEENYRKNGFRDFRLINDSLYTFEYASGRKKKLKKALGLTVNMYEGPQYRIRNITFEGNTIFTSDQLLTSLAFQKGEVFNEQRFEENMFFNKDNTDISSLYNNAGYLFFKIEPDFRPVDGDSIDVHFVITEDEKATIKEVFFTGNTRTHDNVVRRQIRTVPGDYFSRAAVQRSVRELATLGYFVPQNIKPNVINVDYENKTADVIYELDESTSTDNFELSGGFGGQGIGLILAARINFNNFSIQNIGNKEARGNTVPLPTGDGQKLSLGIQITGQGFQTYDFQFSEPWFLGRPNSLGFGVSYSLFNRLGNRSELFNVNMSLGRRLSWPDDYFTQSSSISFQKYDIQNDAFLGQGVANLVVLRQVIERNSLDNFISPNRGSKFTLSGEIAPPAPNFAQYWKTKFKYQHHLQVVGKLVLSNTIEYGYMSWLPFGERSQIGRFRLGGTPLTQRQSFLVENIDLRGFPGGPFTTIAPLNDDGNLEGGAIYNKYAFELRIPAVQNESVQLIPYSFADAGNAYLQFERWDPFRVKRSAGFGLRIFLPVLGLVDLSYGYRFDGIEGTNVRSGSWEFLFNIGPTF